MRPFFQYLQRIQKPSWLLEQRCAACTKPYVQKQTGPFCNVSLCPKCLSAILVNAPIRCDRCGLPITSPSLDNPPQNHDSNTPWVCAFCVQDPPPWTHLYMAGSYEKTMRDVVLRAKFGNDMALLNTLGILLAHIYIEKAQTPTDAVIPVPMHGSRLRERGFDPCLELAKTFSKIVNIPVWAKAATKTRATQYQRELSRTKRRQNVHGAFKADPMVEGKQLLVLDDIITTGSTVQHLVQTLLKQGAASVDVAVIGRAPILPKI